MSTVPVSDAINQPPTPVDASVAGDAILQDAAPHRWSALQRIGFRFAFCYFGGFCIFSGNATIWQAIPFFGYTIERWLAAALALPAQFLAQHVFHVPPPGNHLLGRATQRSTVSACCC